MQYIHGLTREFGMGYGPEERPVLTKNEITSSPPLLFHPPLIQIQLQTQFCAMTTCS